MAGQVLLVFRVKLAPLKLLTQEGGSSAGSFFAMLSENTVGEVGKT